MNFSSNGSKLVCQSASISFASYFGATIKHISPPLDFFINVPHLSKYKINDLEVIINLILIF